MSVAHGYWTHSDPTAPQPTVACLACDRPRWSNSLMCGGCFVRLRSDIDTLIAAHAELGRDMTAIRAGRHDGASHQPPGPRLPFPEPLHDTRVMIEAQLTGWARIIAEEHTPAIHGPTDSSLPTVGLWMAALLPWVSQQQWCDAMAGELGETALSVRRLVPTEPRRRELPGPCPACRMLSLIVYDGDEVVFCRIRTCGHRMPWGQYAALFHGPVYKAPTSAEGVAA